jgi:hypothetical protein
VTNALRGWPAALLIIAALFAVHVSAELLMGRSLICPCGEVRFWYGDIFGPGLSQHVADWYSFTHISHGFLLYGLTHLIAPRAPLWSRLVAVLAIEVTWELVENSPIVIDRYRQSALAQGYVGDSVLNSVSDAVFCLIGFGLAAVLPLRASVGYVAASELALLFLIRDNLALNIWQLLHPTDWLSRWQASGGIVGSGLIF